MSWVEQANNIRYKVMLNHEEQHSIWLADRGEVLGWNDFGFSGSKSARLEKIEVIWTDMRSQSLRKKVEESAHAG